jgi:hypothetical protein
MPADRADPEKKRPNRGNFVSEWFGYRVYPTVAVGRRGILDQATGRCPFLSEVTHEERQCIKPSSSIGVCTISSCSNGPRQDWLVCPYRALEGPLLEGAARRLFSLKDDAAPLIVPAPTLARDEMRRRAVSEVNAGRAVVAYLQDKLGGEISISATDRSPEMAFDITMALIVNNGRGLSIGRYGILEVQTMDFHGSYKYAVNNLRDALRLHGDDFPRVLRQKQGWLSDRIEGPNIANVFKRTFYQIMLKFQIGARKSCAGCVLALPSSVWDSWQKHLGKPVLRAKGDGTFALSRPMGRSSTQGTPAWIFVFDIRSDSRKSPNPLEVRKIIATDAASLSYYALDVAPAAAVGEAGSADRLLTTIQRRLAIWWPELAARS